MPLFKNILVYRIDADWSQPLEAAEQALAPQRFEPCGATQEKSAGWVPPRGQEHGALIESVAGQWLLEFMIEAKTLPASVVRRKAEERAAQIEASTGRKPGKRERRELKEDIRHELLPQAFTRHVRVMVWIDRDARRLVVNTGNATRADELVSALVQAFTGFGVRLIDTTLPPAAAMADWLHSQEPPTGFAIGHECELRATDESKAAVRYARHALEIDEVRRHIEAGKRPTRLALTWEDRVAFELTEGLQLRKIAFLEGTADAAPAAGDGEDDAFDADAAIATGELSGLLAALIEALGGETKPGVAAPSETPAMHETEAAAGAPF